MDDNTDDTSSRWSRLIPMIVLMICFALAETVLYLVAVIQFIWALVNNEPNKQLSEFGASLSDWMAQDAKYLTYVTEEKPFPWAKWPESEDTVQVD